MPTVRLLERNGKSKQLRVKTNKRRNTQLSLSRGSMQALAPRGQGLALGAVRTASAAVAGINPARYIKFYNCTNGSNSGLGIQFRMPLYTICAGATSGGGLKTVSGSILVSSILSPTMAGTLAPQIQRFASCFSRWRWKKLSFLYSPMGSTASGVRLAFAYTNDPLQDQIYAISSYTGFNTLLTTPVSTTFSPWTGWSMSVPCASELMYTYPMNTSVGANVRQSNSGLIACVADSDPGATFSYGTLWWEVDLELYDPAPLATAHLPSSSLSGGPEYKDPPMGYREDAPVNNPNLGPLLTAAISPEKDTVLVETSSTIGVPPLARDVHASSRMCGSNCIASPRPVKT